MSRTAKEILEDTLQLPLAERNWLIENLLQAHDLSSQTDAVRDEEAEPGYEQWFRAGVEEALAETSPGVPHEEAMSRFDEAIRAARKLKVPA